MKTTMSYLMVGVVQKIQQVRTVKPVSQDEISIRTRMFARINKYEMFYHTGEINIIDNLHLD